MLYAARGALTPFFIGAVFVLVFAPLVDRIARALPLHRHHPDLALSLSIALVYLVVGGVLIGAGALLVPRALDEARQLANRLPSLIDRAQHELQDSNGWYQQNVPAEIRAEIDRNWQQVANKAAGFGQDLVSRTLNFARTSLATVVSYIVVPFWAFFVLKDREKGKRFLIDLFPPPVRPDVAYLLDNARAVLGSYIRAQLILSTVTGIVTGIGLSLMGIQFAAILGVVAGIANLVPVIGPMVGGLPAIIVVAATRPGWLILWAFLFLFVAQELKDFILVPRIQGRAVRIHPAVILVLIVVAGHLAGFWGLLLAVPLAAVVRDTFVYCYHRLGQETSPAATATAAVPNPSPADDPIAVGASQPAG